MDRNEKFSVKKGKTFWMYFYFEWVHL